MAKLLRASEVQHTVFADDPDLRTTVVVVTELWDDDTVTYSFREPDTEENRRDGTVGDPPLWAGRESVDLQPTTASIEKMITDYGDMLVLEVTTQLAEAAEDMLEETLPRDHPLRSRRAAVGWLLDFALTQLWTTQQDWATDQPDLHADGVPPTCCPYGCCAACSALRWFADHDTEHADAVMAATGQSAPGQPWGLKLADGSIDWAAVRGFWANADRLDCAHQRS